MILRTWRARASAAGATAYAQHFTEAVMTRLRSVPGFRGAYLLRRDSGEEVEIVVQTLWDSREAVQRFAGPTPDVAVVDADAAAMLTAFDTTVYHYEVLIGPS